MSQIKSKDTKPELLVRKFLFSSGLRYRVNVNKMPGKPDIVLPKYRAVVFVNGCFWHGHKGCKFFVIPKTRVEFWINKIDKNIERDRQNSKKLTEVGWRVITVYECELRSDKLQKTLEDLLVWIKKV